VRVRLFVVFVLLAAVTAGLFTLSTQRRAATPAPASISPADASDFDFPVETIAPRYSTLPASRDEPPREVDGSKDCPNREAPFKSDGSEEAHKARAIALANELARTGDADYLLAAALLSRSARPDRPLELLVRASDIAPRNRLVAWNRLTMCRDRRVADCDLKKTEADAIEVDGTNGAVWMEIAMRRLAGDKQDAAVAAVRRAIAAPRMDHYFIDHVIVLERALASRSDLSYRDRVFQAMGYSAALTVPYYGITEHCDTVSEDLGVWIELCDQLGAKMFVDGRTLLDQAIGRALQKIAAKRSGDTDWMKRSTAEYEEFKAHYDKLLSDRSMQALLENDAAVLRQYVENFSTYGELEAQTRLRMTRCLRVHRIAGVCERRYAADLDHGMAPCGPLYSHDPDLLRISSESAARLIRRANTVS